ncbi:ribonuclease H2, subunit C [Schizophyllum fasciatum]
MSLRLQSSCAVRQLPAADPNLLPFHVAHTGPAPVSAYFLVQPAKEAVGAPAAMADASTAKPDASTTKADASTTKADASETEGDASMTGGAPGAASSGPSKRLVSAFRGRTVHGLRVDVPAGYHGLVLRADGQRARDSKPQTGRPRRDADARLRGADAELRGADAELRGAADAGLGDADDTLLAADADAAPPDDAARLLRPAAQFSALTVWAADIPVDAARDDYVRALAEWTALAGEIHRMD